MARKSNWFGKCVRYAALRTVNESVYKHNRRVRPNISREENIYAAVLAYQCAKALTCKSSGR